MILHYWRPPASGGEAVTNFGDELNTLLFPRLLGDSFFDDDDRVAFLGIGSLLGWPKPGDDTRHSRIVFGTGAAFPDAAQREPRDARWQIYCVRGPLTARAYQLDEALAITDPAILVARLYERRQPTARFGYMPHLDEASEWSPLLAHVCADLGVVYIDPRDDVEAVITAIASVSVLVTEAMHGAIVADSLRIPWIPVFTTARPHRFKWSDWCQSMEIEFDPHRIGNVASLCARRGLRSTHLERMSASLFKTWLHRVSSNCRPALSDPRIHAERLQRLEAALTRLQSDVAKGMFSFVS
jgi:succinoglycan biosynthesis protein ExoV